MSAPRNVFRATHAHTLRCTWHSYDPTLSRLTVHAFKPDGAPAFAMLFTDVAAVHAPVTWQGARFDVAPAAALWRAIEQAGLAPPVALRDPLVRATLGETLRLYVLHAGAPDAPTVAVLAGGTARLPL